jgi:hypothetical protein
MTNLRRLIAALTATVAMAVLPAGAALANGAGAGNSDAPDTSLVSTQVVTKPMTFGGYNVAVAEANGYKIVTATDGTQSPVPVTAQAKAETEVTPMNTVPGDCGTSSLSAAKLANDTLAVHTSYNVPFAVAQRSWRVNAQSILGWNASIPFSGPTGGFWSGDGTAWIVGPGVAIVPLTAWVMSSTGQTCYSGGPTAAL